MIYQENNNNINSADFCAQRGNRGTTICEKIQDSRSEEMAKFLETSNDHSGGQNLQLQNMNQVTPNYLLSNGMKEMSVRPNHTARITVHPSGLLTHQHSAQSMIRICRGHPCPCHIISL